MYTLPPDPYLALAVPKDADDKAIKASYRKLILSCHPDKVQDPELKAQKQAEFQQVQQAYELLTSPDARKNYDRKARLNEEMSRMPASSPMNTRTPPRNPYPDVNIRTAEPRPNTFSKSGPSPSSSKFYSASNTSSRSWEDELGRSYGSKKSSSDKYQDYEPDEKPSKRDSGRHRRREEAEWERERARAAEAEEKKKSKEKKSHERSSEKKKADKERKRDGDSKHHSRSPYVETFTPDDEEEEDVIYGKPPRSDRKKSTSSRKHDDGIQEAARNAAATDRERKNSDTMDFATRYLQRSGGKPPSLARSKTYHEQAYFATPAVPTPPPAHSAVYPPPPQPRARDVMGEEDMGRRSSGKSASRRMSNDTSKSSRDKSAAPKKSSTRGASRDARPVILEGGSPLPRVVPVFAKSQTTSAAGLANMVSGQSPRTPGLHRASTDQYARPQATPSKERSRTWGNSGGDRRHKQQQWEMSDEDDEDDEEEEKEEEDDSSEDSEESTSEEEPAPPPRRSRRARSPEPMPMPTQASRTQTTYKVAGGKTASRQTYATAEPAMSKKDRVKATYAPPKNKANTGVARSMEYESYDYEAAAANAWQYQQQHAQMAPGYASGIQYSPMFDEGDIAYSKVRHAAAH